MIDGIYLTVRNNRNSKRGSGKGAGELTMSSIYEQNIYSKGNRSGIAVWHVVYHVPQNSKLQSFADTTEPGPGILLLEGVQWMMSADSAELGHKKQEINNPGIIKNTNDQVIIKANFIIQQTLSGYLFLSFLL